MRSRRPSSFAARVIPPTVVPRGEFEGEGVRWVAIADAPPEADGQPTRPRRPVFVCACGEVMTLRRHAINRKGLVSPNFSHDRGQVDERAIAAARVRNGKAYAARLRQKLQAELDARNPSKGCGYREPLRLRGYKGPAWKAGQDWQDEAAPIRGTGRPKPRERYHRDPIDKAHDQALEMAEMLAEEND